jgi:hypothetical protein
MDISHKSRDLDHCRCLPRLQNIMSTLGAGKWTKLWAKFRAKLKIEYEDRGIMTCELRFAGCWYDNALSFAHRHLRDWYKKRGYEYLLGEFNQTILACTHCHDIIEKNDEKTEKAFNQLRGPEELPS